MKKFISLCSLTIGLILILVLFWANAIWGISVEMGWAIAVTAVIFILVGFFSSDLMDDF